MHASSDFTRSRADSGPAVYFGYCGRSNRYRLMDLPDYLSNAQEGLSRWVSDASTMYQDLARGSASGGTGSVPSAYGLGRDERMSGAHAGRTGRCGCASGDTECQCDCCVCDADVLVHARCGEVRRIPVTFDNDRRREQPVTLELGAFTTAGGRDVKWAAQLSETAFTLRPCDAHTVMVNVQVRCDAFGTGSSNETPTPEAGDRLSANQPAAVSSRVGDVDRCEVAYASLRADGCLIRPVVIAIAVLPIECDAYRRPCSCGCCH